MKIKIPFEITDFRNLYFMSDLHYGHQNIISIDKRPYKDIDEMNAYIKSELITKLRPTDVLFDLGDLFWKTTNIKEAREVLDSIPCISKFKVVGNHDPYKHYLTSETGLTNNLCDRFKLVSDILDIHVKYQGKEYLVTLCHYPILDWNHQYQGGLQIYGHTHGHTDKWAENNPRLMVDIGFSASLVKSYGSFLVPFSEIIKYFQNKTGGIDFYDWAKTKYHEAEFWNAKE